MLIFFCKGGILKNIPFTYKKTFYKNLYGTGSLISAPFPTAHKLITQMITFKIIIIGPRKSPKIGPINGIIKINATKNNNYSKLKNIFAILFELSLTNSFKKNTTTNAGKNEKKIDAIIIATTINLSFSSLKLGIIFSII